MYQGSKFLVKMAHVHVDRSIEGAIFRLTLFRWGPPGWPLALHGVPAFQKVWTL